ncbi:sensor histidine kinase [Ketobacter alkanivorans]|uniref:histidine kinase n=1 Tax=Ketobacter alkanivorans TaxID=1917421 RepID=A0A2K9LK35_9GAMM|nr:PAS domain S-box protein [Ketobacter alkanivorans]AUM12642.1 histidine kinase [Ketobacter alkanivorans]MCP5014983.1 PAS domain S-box protein [Ketobacter sp.]
MTTDIDLAIDNDEVMRLVVEASPNGMVLIDLQGRIVMVNTSIETMFGYRRDELISQAIEQLVPVRFRKHHPHMRKQYFALPKSRAMGQGRELYGLHKDGTEFPVEIGLNPITTQNGILVLAAIVDITERQRAQEMMRLAVEAAPNGMLLTDKTGRIVMANSMAEMQFGYTRSELVGQEITMLVPPRFRDHHPALREDYFSHPVSRAMGKGRDLFALRKDGQEIPVEIGLNPISTVQGMMILASVVDITDRKQQEERLKSALKEKEVMLAEIHHRVKNNLQIIDSLIAMQLDNVDDEKARFLLTDSQNRIKSMAVIHQTLYQSQDFSNVDIATVITGLVNNLSHSYGDSSRSDIKVYVDAEAIALPIESSIPLGLIVNELVSNAFKHAFPNKRPGEIRISLSLTPEQKIKLEINDNGIGMPTQRDSTDSLGLRLVEALSDQLEATLTIHPVNPTTFTILI